MTTFPATALEPPYYAVIFASVRTSIDHVGYHAMAERMVELAREQPGFLGVESVRDASGNGLTVSYWQTLEAIAAWRRHAEHAIAQREGKRQWYAAFRLRTARVEREYGSEDSRP